MIECSLAQECEGERKGTGATTALAVFAWPVPLSPLGFSASNPIKGAESLAYWCSAMPCLEGVHHLSGLIH